MVFVYPVDATFIRTDLELLQTLCDVSPLPYRGRFQYPAMLGAIAKADLVVCWFALGFSVVATLGARLMGRPSITIAGGWDVTGMPEIGYGRLVSGRGALTAAIALSAASQVLAFSNWSRERIREVAPRSNVRTSYLGVDTRKFAPAREKEAIVVCTAHLTRENLLRKGLRDFVQASRRIPDARFVLVGRHVDDAVEELRALAGPNFAFPGWLPDADLRGLLSRAKVYAQPSYTEGFGVALAEAMSCGCVPVVTRAGALPEVVGETGLYVEYGDPVGLADALRTALGSGLGIHARRRIEEHFNLDRRFADLHRAVRDALHVSEVREPVSLRLAGSAANDGHEN